MKPVYFASDFHLGLDMEHQTSIMREAMIIQWLESIRKKNGILHLVGDIFDYWFEYKQVIPKGFHHIFSTLSKMHQEGWEIHYHTGNHDMWVGEHFTQTFGAIIHRDPFIVSYNNKRFFIAHGDGLGKGDHAYKFIKSIFSSAFNQWLFAKIHPNLGIGIMKYASGKSRLSHTDAGEMGDKTTELLLNFAEEDCKINHCDYYIFGHRHLPAIVQLENKKSLYINLGDWLNHKTYLIFENESIQLLDFN